MSWGRFDTRTIVMIPIAIAINIVLGQTVSAVLKIPIYLDSVGTILVGVVAGPIPGLVTGALANLVWTYVLPAPFHSDYAAPFFVVAMWIGFWAGITAQLGFFRSRPNSTWGQVALAAVVVLVVLGGIGYYGFLPFYTNGQFTFFGDTTGASTFFVVVGYVAVAGLICGIVSAIISAPISAYVFGGVTGSGTDLLVAAFQQAGADLTKAVLQQGLLSDPIDKTIEFLLVYVILQALSRRFIARFPQGEKAIGLEEGA